MTWVRLDDHFDENPKIARVGPLAVALWVTGLAYCNRNLTDGFIPFSTAHRMCYDAVDYTPEGSAGVINRLINAGLWDACDGGFQIHDYGKYQPSRAEVEAERSRLSVTRAKAGRRGGQRSGEARSKSEAKAKQTSNQTRSKSEATGSANTNQIRSPVPVPVPDPVPDPKPTSEPIGSSGWGDASAPDFTPPPDSEMPKSRVLLELYGPLLQHDSNLRIEAVALEGDFNDTEVLLAIDAARLDGIGRPWPRQIVDHMPKPVLNRRKQVGVGLGYDR